MYYKITLKAETTYYINKEKHPSKHLAVEQALEWFETYYPEVLLEEVENEGD